MRSKIFGTIALLASLAFIGTIALAQPTVMSKETGPAASGNFNKYWSDSFSYGYESMSIQFWPSGTPQNPIMNLRYNTYHSICFVEDAFCIQGEEVFQGPIPFADVTYSGRPQWNGSFQIALDVDTTSLPSAPGMFKVGDGGRVQFTCTQDPNQDVTSWSGQQTVQNLSGSTKKTGSSVFMQGNATSRIWFLPFAGAEFSSTCGMNWFQLTLLNK
jgi:hypothetical protein